MSGGKGKKNKKMRSLSKCINENLVCKREKWNEGGDLNNLNVE